MNTWKPIETAPIDWPERKKKYFLITHLDVNATGNYAFDNTVIDFSPTEWLAQNREFREKYKDHPYFVLIFSQEISKEEYEGLAKFR